ncbi:FHAD1 protein, partial [Baryphthengus martii]|nr:FHAD1 protein [Baryphthengus martii]
RDEQLKTVREETELQRQKLQEEMAEYKEQSKQHSLTIVALEDRLQEAKQQQKALEEENAALVAKMEGAAQEGVCGSFKSTVSLAIIFLRRFRVELAAMQSTLLSKEAVIAGLTKELTETRARMSDLKGELSEEQKVKLEQNLSQLKRQEQELNVLREKLCQMSSLAEEKDRALQAAAEELRYVRPCPGALQKLLRRFQQLISFRSLPGSQRQDLYKNQLGCFFQEPVLDLAELGAKCRGLRHEETIKRQRDDLAELRERVKMLEKRQSSAAMMKGSEQLVVLPKDLPEKIVQEIGLEKEPAPVSRTQLKADKVPNGCSHGAADGAASLKRADETDFGEKMYLDVIGALGSLLKVKELSGMQPLKHLPQEEREKVGLRRRKALELLYDKIRNLKTRLERKEEMLKDCVASVEQMRLNEASLQRCREEMSKLEDEASREAEEKALLKEALERTQLQLHQEKKLLRAAKLHKV